MFRRSKFRPAVAWALLFAVLFNIALPSLANAMRPAAPMALGEICSTSGLKAIVTPGADRAPASHADLLHDGHCQLCTIEPVEVLASVLFIPLPIIVGSSYPPVRSTPIPATQQRSIRPPSQAPPVLS